MSRNRHRGRERIKEINKRYSVPEVAVASREEQLVVWSYRMSLDRPCETRTIH